MLKSIPYSLLFLIIISAISTGCNNGKILNERVTLWRNDKIPYGTFYAFQNLHYFFKNADIEINKFSPVKYNAYEPDTSQNEGRATGNAYIIISPSMEPDQKELDALFRFISEGNQVFISAFEIGQNLLDSLKLKTSMSSGLDNLQDSLTINIFNPGLKDSLSFSYPGRAMDNYFESMDSSITYILGKNNEGKADFVKVSYEGGGAIYLQLAPIAFTNFFLLHKKNKDYYDHALSFLPPDIPLIQWDDYYRYHSNGMERSGRNEFSKLRAFLNNEILRWPVWMVFVLFILIYIFESKRKQRIIPVIAPLRNASLDFVRTIGRLYFDRKDNKNLASKMTAHFLDFVRNRYNISTSNLNEEFENRLAFKTDYNLQAIRDIVYQIRFLQDQPVVDDDQLLDFNDKLDNFYKQL